jgi:hypothetical protein
MTEENDILGDADDLIDGRFHHHPHPHPHHRDKAQRGWVQAQLQSKVYVAEIYADHGEWR